MFRNPGLRFWGLLKGFQKLGFKVLGSFFRVFTHGSCDVVLQMSKSIKRLEKEKAALKLKCDKSEMLAMEVMDDVSTQPQLRFHHQKSICT